MKKTYMVLFCAFIGLLASCSSDDGVKSSKNYIESFEVAGIKGEIKNDQSLILFIVFPEDYEKLMKQQYSESNFIINRSENSNLSPGSGHWTEKDFFTITAENGEKRIYSVRIELVRKKYSFESWALSNDTNGYYIPSDSNSSWTSGNEGISWALSILGPKDREKNPENYPTRKTAEGYNGSNAVLLETIEGGPVIGRKKPLFSGNFILGNFNMNVAFTNELAATEIGRIYPAKPEKIIGYYKYKEGDKAFISGENADTIPDRSDFCSMIVKFYKSDLPGGGDTTLTVANIDESELVIAETRKEDCSATAGDEFHPFELKLEYKPGKEQLDPQSRYKLGMTFAASKDGDTFSGRIGSRLIIDEIEIIDYEE
jgi:hypothetical protein